MRQAFMERGSDCPCTSSKWYQEGSGFLLPAWREGANCRACESPRKYDALLMVDTDVILGPGVLRRMWEVDADVVYGVYYTRSDWGGSMAAGLGPASLRVVAGVH